MKKEIKNLFYCLYGSKLYGTSTPSSDTDEKVVYLPPLNDMLLGKKAKIFKVRIDKNGLPVPDGDKMPDDGAETEYIPVQTFVQDFVKGQTYALEIANSYNDKSHFMSEMIEKFSNSDIYSMVGFAKKQTLDYVYRGRRLNAAREVFDTLTYVAALNGGADVRLDAVVNGQDVLKQVCDATGLLMGSALNNNKLMRTLELNGRSYLESTTIEQLIGLVKKQIDSYGERTNLAARTDVDYKSLSHAVRCYQQAIELLDTGKISFPRPNAEMLLSIKQGKEEADSIKELLVNLDEEVQRKIESSTIRKRTQTLEQEADAWLVCKLRDFYSLDC